MDYELFESEIQNFFETHVNPAIAAVNSANRDFQIPDVGKIVNGYPDATMQSVPVVLYFFMTDSPDDYCFEEFSCESEMMTAKMSVYIVLKNLKLSSTQLDSAIKRYSMALDNLIHADRSLSQTVDHAYITGSHIFSGADGDTNARALRKSIKCEKEIR